MISLNEYLDHMSSYGNNVGDIRRKQADMIMDFTFDQDPNYKQVRVLTDVGWMLVDAKYQYHSTPSISKDAVDYYLQFRPGVHFPVGSYVIVKDDLAKSLHTFDEDKKLFAVEYQRKIQEMDNQPQLWMIVGRNNATQFVRYNILKCNWNFQWIVDGEIKNCIGCVRNASSYTSGIWTDEYSTSLNNITAAWLPDVRYIYEDAIDKFGLDNNQTIVYGMRFMLSHNDYDPRVYKVTKVLDIAPQGLIKLTLKQDDLNKKTDNIDLRICDYFTDTGNIVVNQPDLEYANPYLGSEIVSMEKSPNNELEESVTLNTTLHLGETVYYKAKYLPEGSEIDPEWRIEIIGNYTDEEVQYYEKLVKVTELDDHTVAIRPGKANSLIGKQFRLTVQDLSGNYYSSTIELTVEVKD